MDSAAEVYGIGHQIAEPTAGDPEAGGACHPVCALGMLDPDALDETVWTGNAIEGIVRLRSVVSDRRLAEDCEVREVDRASGHLQASALANEARAPHARALDSTGEDRNASDVVGAFRHVERNFHRAGLVDGRLQRLGIVADSVGRGGKVCERDAVWRGWRGFPDALELDQIDVHALPRSRRVRQPDLRALADCRAKPQR